MDRELQSAIDTQVNAFFSYGPGYAIVKEMIYERLTQEIEAEREKQAEHDKDVKKC